MLKKLLLVVTLLLVFTTLANAGTGQGKRGSCKHCHNGTIPAVGTVLSCGGCHVNSPATGAHRAHTDGSGAIYGSDANDSILTYRFNCGNCHAMDPAKHGNSITDLELYNPAATGFKSKNPATAGLSGNGSATVCNSIYCHSAGLPAVVNSYAATPSWGGGFSGNSCAGCHSFPPNYTNNAPKANSHVPHNFSCTTCHAGTTADGATISNASAHVNGSFDVAPGAGTAFTYAYAPTGGTCGSISCHGYTNATWGGTVDCGGCHGNPPPNAAGGYTGVAEATSPHMKHAGKGANYSYACSQCHKGNTHGTGTFQDVFIDKNGILAGPAATYATGTRTCSAVNCHGDGTSIATGQPTGGSVVWGSGKLGCTGCHGGPPAYANNSPKANSHLSPSHRVGCNTCHVGTTSNGTTITDLTRHVNGAYDLQPGSGVSFTYSYAPGGGTCNSISCHGALSATWGGTATCLVCHSVVQGTRAAITAQFGANSHHVQGAVTDAQCYQCHWEANSNGSINPAYHSGSAAPGAPVDLVVYGAGARPAAYNTVNFATAIQYTANGTRAEIQKLNYHCLGCHSDQNNTTQPFGDGKTPKQYAWDGSSVAARYSQSGTTPWGKYAGGNVSQKTTQTKAFSAHGNAVQNKGGWDTNETWPDTRNSTTNVTCYDCHNSHGSGVSGTTTSYASATVNAGILKDTVAGKGGYSQTYKPSSGGSSDTKNAFTAGAGLCFDCHQNATTGTKPWGYSDTFGATQKIIGYWDTDFFGPGTFGSQTRFPYKANTGHQGGHFGASAALSSSSSHAIGGLCTPCHDPHGVSPSLGADKQYAVPLLKGTWVTSPYREDTAPASNVAGTAIFEGVPYHIDQNTFASGGVTQTDTQFAGLCLSCHSKPSLTNGSNHTWKGKDRIHEAVKGWKTANGTIQHNFTCSKCHAPHNSRLPRLMVTNCLNGMHKGRVGYNPSPVLSGSGSGDEYNCDSPIGACWDFGQWDDWNGGGSGGIPGNFSGTAVGTNSIACHEGNSADESWNSVTPWNNLLPPTSPTGISATAGNMLMIVSWTAGTGESVSSLIRYGTTSGVYTTTIDPATSPRVVTGLANGTTIYYQVGAKNAAGTVWSGQYSVTPVLTLPSAPTGIAATAGNAQTVISWTAGLGSTSSLIRYGTTSGNYTTTIDPATSPKVVTGLTNGTTIYYQVGAKNAAGTVWSVQYSVTPVLPLPSAPTGISAIAGNAQATVSWSAGANSTSSLIRYGTIYGNYPNIIDPATSPRVITGLVNGTYHYYQVGAKNATGITWSGVYSVRPVLPPPSAPTAISAVAGNAQATVSWTAGANSTSSLIRYGTVPGTYPNIIDPATSPRTITGLTNGTIIYYQVGAKNAAGTIAWSGQYSVTPVGPPSAPTGISSVAGNAQATISWTAGAGSTSSLIRYGTVSGSYTTTIDPATSPRTITGLTNGTTIYYQVGAKNAAGTIAWSVQYSVTPLLPVPSAPTGISAVAGNAQATITWVTGVSSTSSLIRYGTTSGVYSTTIDPAASPRVISSLTNGTTIYYQVGAKNAAGTTWSTEYSFIPAESTTQTWTTPGTYSYVVPAGVTSITATVKGGGGGGGLNDSEGNQVSGSNGNLVATVIPVTPGSTLTIYVSSGGYVDAYYTDGGAGGSGYHAGSPGSSGQGDGSEYAYGGSGGGGSSAITLAAVRLVEAAGGAGGRSSDYYSYDYEYYYSAGEGGAGGGSDYPAISTYGGGGSGGNEANGGNGSVSISIAGTGGSTINLAYADTSTPYLNKNIYDDAKAAGWNGTSAVTINVTINSGVVIGSSSSTSPALITNNPTAAPAQTFPVGTVLTVTNNGTIAGAGGYGGGSESAGGAGGDAFVVNYPLTLNNQGNISGGGGGGGGGADDHNDGYGGTGGQGAGLAAAQAGEYAYEDYHNDPSSCVAVSGGNGGVLGFSGDRGEDGNEGSAGGAGGAPGWAITGIDSVTNGATWGETGVFAGNNAQAANNEANAIQTVRATPAPPSAPTGISAIAGNAQAIITWTVGTGSTASLIRYGTTSGSYPTVIDPATPPSVITGLANGTAIYYQVGAKNSSGTTWSVQYSVTPLLPVPSAPTAISSTAGNAQATISWTAGTGSTSSLIRYGTTSGVYPTIIDPATSPRVITGLANGTTIYYQVCAKNSSGTTCSGQYSVTPLLPLPSAPTAISATAGNAQATISWTTGTGATSSLIRYGTTSGSYPTVIDPATSPRVITGLTNGTVIYYQVGAKNSSGTTWSIEYSVTPVVTQSITVTFPVDHHVQMTEYGGVWIDPANDAIMFVGPFEDGNGWSVDRSFISFNTSSLGPGATVTSAKLYLDYQNSDYVADNSVTNVHESTWNLDIPVYDTIGNFLNSYTVAYNESLGLKSFVIAPNYINRFDSTKFALKANDETLNNADPGYSRAGSYLEITYTSATPSAPTAISATAGNTQVSISWTAGTGSTSSLIRYGTTTGVYTTTIDPATSPQTISSLTNGMAIYYQVGAKNAAGTTWSTQYSVIPVASNTKTFSTPGTYYWPVVGDSVPTGTFTATFDVRGGGGSGSGDEDLGQDGEDSSLIYAGTTRATAGAGGGAGALTNNHNDAGVDGIGSGVLGNQLITNGGAFNGGAPIDERQPGGGGARVQGTLSGTFNTSSQVTIIVGAGGPAAGYDGGGDGSVTITW